MEEPQKDQGVRTNIFTLDDKEFNYDDISASAKSAIKHIQVLDNKINELNFSMDELKISRLGFISILKEELAKDSE